MLQAATPEHLDFIRRVLREGAAEGSFEAEIAGDSVAASLFFANMADALRSGYLRTPDAQGNPTREVHVAGYVYRPREGAPLVGFGLFKEIGSAGFELWLTGIAAEARRQGHGRAMLGELLATPPGQMTCMIRCVRSSASGEIAGRLFREYGFAPCRETPRTLWLVSAKAPPELLARIAALPAATA